MKGKLKKLIIMCLIIGTMMTLTTITTHAISLDYSGGSSSNDTGAGASTSGYQISIIDPAYGNVCGYRFSVVNSSGTLKSNSKVINVYLSDKTYGTSAYSSGQRFIISSGVVANKKKLASGTKVSSSKTTQDCDYKSGSCGFYSTLPQNPANVGSWIKNKSNSYLNLLRVYKLCGLDLSKASESDYVLIEPIFWIKLANVNTATTATELAIYGANISGGSEYDGCNGNLYNAGETTLWNLCNYINREFPNMLYVSSDTAVYSAVTIKTSGRYTYKRIIQNGFGVSVLKVSNVLPYFTVKYRNSHDEEYGAGIMPDQKIIYGNDTKLSANKFTRTGYHFKGWKLRKTIDGENVYKGYNSSSEAGWYSEGICDKYGYQLYSNQNTVAKTVPAGTTVYMWAQWTPNKVNISYNVNGGVLSSSSTYTIDNGHISNGSTLYFDYMNYGQSDDPYNASTFGLKRTGYQFAGWKVRSTGIVLGQDTEYASTVYAQYDDSSKTTKNKATVYCYLDAQWIPNNVKLSYNVNGGTISSSTYSTNNNGHISDGSTLYFDYMNYGESDDPYNASTFGLTRAGYQFAGWKVRSTGKVLDQNTQYASTVYAQYDDSSKTTANAVSVVCYLDAQWTPNKVKIAYHPNGGTTSKSLNDSGYILLDGAAYFQTINHGTKGNPYNASTLELTRTGYTFKGWTVAGTSTVLNQDTDYASTVYKQYNDSSKTTANTTTVYCHLIAKWEKNTYTNTIVHWKYVGTGGDNANGTYKKMGTSTFNGIYANTITIPTSLVQTYTGHYNTGVAGSYWGTETWSHKNIGSTFTQPAKAVSIEYYYRPKTLTVIFNKNDGSGSTASQTFTYGVAGNQFGYNNDGTPKWGNNSGQFGAWDRENYTLLGWSENPDATASTYSVYNTVSNSWINTKVPDPNTSKTINLYAVWNSSAKIVIVPIEPNGSYRENTDVVSSFWLVNISGDDYIPSTGASVVFNVYNASGTKIASSTQSFVSPNNDKNLAYFKWHVPNGYGGTNIKIKAHIVDEPYTYSNVERSYRIADYLTYKTPDTDYKDKAPNGFTVPSSSFDNAAKARWWQWHYVNGSFVKKEYAVTNTINNLQLTADTNPSAYWNNGTLYMKSGYGFGCSYTHSMLNVSGYQSNSISESVAPQYFYALFPEYNYKLETNKCRSFTTISGRKTFVNATGMGNQHFTPIYYPDGAYKFQVVLSDCWTPAGMLTTYKTVTIQINGSMYDDWYVGRK